MAQVLELHGESGDRCWNPQVCHARRTYYRHRQKYIAAKWQRRHAPQEGPSCSQTARGDQPQPESPLELSVKLPDYAVPVLQVYRSNASSEVHAVGAELWVGGNLVTRVQPKHTLGMTEGQVKQYLRQVLQELSERYGVELKGFGSQVTLDPVACPLQPCPLRPGPHDLP